MDSHLDPLLVLMIETPHPVHTHSRSSLYIYKVFEHLQQWLRVIGMSLTPHPRKTHSYHRVFCVWAETTITKLPKCRESRTCRQMSCRLDTLADMQCRRVGDMNEDMSPTCHQHDMSANEGLGRHDRLRHSLLSRWVCCLTFVFVGRRFDFCGILWIGTLPWIETPPPMCHIVVDMSPISANCVVPLICISFGRGALKNNTLSIILHFNSLYLLLSQCDCFRPCI